ncbi:phytosulfokines-like [Juglans regia]|uniref:Phytosulfokine n=1 Tax=Juglans regia TaxID=51240 RepID=A0A2I4HNM3_JUGRE|nr:phytosulfokines-like [Juglans regia]
MSTKLGTLWVITLLLSYSLNFATARPEPTFSDITPMKTQHRDDQLEKVMEERCEGAGQEDCLERRTLAAHIDYIYTQKNKP